MRKPLCIDLFCGLFGWSSGFVAEGWDVIGFDLEDMHANFSLIRPSEFRLVIQNVLTIHGSQFRNADCLVASPPCQAYSFMAMPWRLGKTRAAAIRADTTGAELERLNRLFVACFRIQREACEAAARHIPLIVENVRGAIPWVGRSRWNFGSYHLWGDVPALMPVTLRARKSARGSCARLPGANGGRISNWPHLEEDGRKLAGFRFDGSGRSFQSASVAQMDSGIKCGGDWFNSDQPSISRMTSSKFPARKAASTMIAKIPEPLARWIARCFYPRATEAA